MLYIASDKDFFKPTYELQITSAWHDSLLIYEYQVQGLVADDLQDDCLNVTIACCQLLGMIAIRVSDGPNPILEEAFKLAIDYISKVTDLDITASIDEVLSLIRSGSSDHLKVDNMKIWQKRWDEEVELVIDAGRTINMDKLIHECSARTRKH